MLVDMDTRDVMYHQVVPNNIIYLLQSYYSPSWLKTIVHWMMEKAMVIEHFNNSLWSGRKPSLFITLWTLWTLDNNCIGFCSPCPASAAASRAWSRDCLVSGQVCWAATLCNSHFAQHTTLPIFVSQTLLSEHLQLVSPVVWSALCCGRGCDWWRWLVADPDNSLERCTNLHTLAGLGCRASNEGPHEGSYNDGEGPY